MRRSLGVKCFLASGKALSDNHRQRSCRLREPADNANFTLSQLLTARCGCCQTAV
jgi:hypothetical protein